ncbi:hypothetical protein [Absidia glauca]|uniref:FAR1 domain-containing protein n=1 Tax=Absidia glauca TaxID=4829 RepID=A0A163IUB4_ABSGL|nr:hypothetical protein [Absidia glauca]
MSEQQQVPAVGMEFSTLNECRDFCQAFAKQSGFAVVTHYSNNKRGNIMLECVHHRKYRSARLDKALKNKTDSSKTKGDDSHDSKTNDGDSKSNDDDSKIEGDDSKIEGDNCKIEGDDSDIKGDDSEMKDDDSEIKDDNNTTKDDNNTTKDDNNTTKDDNNTTKDDNNTTKGKDNTAMDDDNTTKNDDNINLDPTNPGPTKKTRNTKSRRQGCPARFSFYRGSDSSKKYRLISMELEHNHPMASSPAAYHEHRKLNHTQRAKVAGLVSANVAPRTIVELMATDGCIITAKDVANIRTSYNNKALASEKS